MPNRHFATPKRIISWPDKEVPWLWQISNDALLNLLPDDIIWYREGDDLLPACVSQASNEFASLSEPTLEGIQVHYWYADCRGTRTQLILNGEQTGLYKVNEDALHGFNHEVERRTRIEQVKLVAKGGSG